MTPTGLLTIGPLSVPVNVLRARDAYGRLDLQVSPIGGRGEQWVSADRVAINDPDSVVRRADGTLAMRQL